jgi:hypothetical protein
VTRLVAELDQTHIRSAPNKRGSNIPLTAGKAQAGETILNLGWLGHVRGSVAHPDLPGLIRSRWMAICVARPDQAVFIVAPSMTTPAVAYFQKAMRSFRAKAVIIVLRMRPFMPTRWWNQRLSAESG